MSVDASLRGIALLLIIMALFSLLEMQIPQRVLGAWRRRHLAPNLTLTLLTYATNLVYNIPILLGLLWLQRTGFGLFNAVELHPVIEIGGAILALDLAWYVTHVSMHKVAALWPFHAVHHSDPAVDVTTTVRQHPVEGVIRYVYLAAFGCAIGASPAAFAIYRIWSALHGQFEHANLKLPQWLDTAISFVFVSPNMHKIHHSRDWPVTDHNYSNIFSIWDRLFATFVASKHGREINYGLADHDGDAQQSIAGLLIGPFRARASRRALSTSSIEQSFVRHDRAIAHAEEVHDRHCERSTG